MAWIVEYTDEFGVWWDALSESEQVAVDAHVRQLAQRGPSLPFPLSSGISGSRHGHLRELRVQRGGRPLRIFYAFDPRRVAILLIGSDKTGDDRFYDRMVRSPTISTTCISEKSTRRRTMAGRTSFAELRARMSPEAQAAADRGAARIGEELDLAEVRRAMRLSQEELAQTLQIGQGSVAKIEKRTDMYVSTVRRFIEAMGGELEIVARFPGRIVKIKTFQELAEQRDP